MMDKIVLMIVARNKAKTSTVVKPFAKTFHLLTPKKSVGDITIGCPPVANTHGGNIRVTGQGEDSKPHPSPKKEEGKRH